MNDVKLMVLTSIILGNLSVVGVVWALYRGWRDLAVLNGIAALLQFLWLYTR